MRYFADGLNRPQKVFTRNKFFLMQVCLHVSFGSFWLCKRRSCACSGKVLPDLKEGEILLLGIGQHFSGWLALIPARKADHLSEQAEVGLVRNEGQHYEICVQSVQTMPLIRLIVWLPFGPAYVLHDFVLTLSWDIMPYRHTCL